MIDLTKLPTKTRKTIEENWPTERLGPLPGFLSIAEALEVLLNEEGIFGYSFKIVRLMEELKEASV